MEAKYHPDHYINNPLADLAAQKMRKINEAYEILGDLEKRKIYDNTFFTACANENSYSYEGENAYSYEQLLNKVNFYIEKRMWSEAHLACEKAIFLDTQRVESFCLKSYIFYEQNNLVEAYEFARKAEKRGILDGEFFLFFSFILMDLNKYSEAIHKLEKARSILGDVPNILAYLALNYEMNGNEKNSKWFWNKLKEIDPNNPILKQREKMYKVGSTYVNKDDAEAGACWLCVLLECIFDCC